MFTLFPHLPFELRALIWYYALPPPRFIHIPELHTNPIPTTPPHRSPSTFLSLSSASPPPTLLSICRESRSFILTTGNYTLSFRSVYNSQPGRTYFNFDKDVLFLPLYRRKYGMTYFVERFDFAKVDRVRVKKIAVVVHPDLRLGWGLFHVLQAFGNVEEVLLVWTVGGVEWNRMGENGGLWLRERRGEELGYVECEIPDGLGKYFFKEDMLGLHFKRMIKEYKEETGDRCARGFFRGLAENVMVRIGKERDEFFRNTTSSVWRYWDVPNVKIVQIMGRDEARRLVAAKEKYWARLEELEERERECGPDPPSPFSEQWTDELEVEREYFEWEAEMAI
jgi:hypothetical protein